MTEQKQIKDAALLMQRMIPHLLAGATFEAAGREVLKRDRELMLVATAPDEIGDFIRKQLTVQCFAQINIEVAIEKKRLQTIEQSRLAVLATLDR